MPNEIVLLLARHSGAKVERFARLDFGRAKDPQSISALVDRNEAEGLLAALRRELPSGLVAFVGTTHSLAEERQTGVELVVGPGRDQFDILRLSRSDGVNYDLGTEALVKTLRAMHSVDPIDIFQAETDTVQFRLLAPAKDPAKLAEQIYAFCPDTVDQGVGSVEALQEMIVEARRVFLWWD